MRSYILITISIITMLSIYSCKHKEKEELNIKEFLSDAARINQKETQLSMLAKNKGIAEEVKNIGRTIETDHIQLFTELQNLAQLEAVALPAISAKNDSVTLSKAWNKFDKTYCELMTEEYKKSIRLYENASAKKSDSVVKNWINQTLPTLRKNLDLVMTCNEKIKY